MKNFSQYDCITQLFEAANLSLVKIGANRFTTKEHDSLIINGKNAKHPNTFYWNSNGYKGSFAAALKALQKEGYFIDDNFVAQKDYAQEDHAEQQTNAQKHNTRIAVITKNATGKLSSPFHSFFRRHLGITDTYFKKCYVGSNSYKNTIKTIFEIRSIANELIGLQAIDYQSNGKRNKTNKFSIQTYQKHLDENPLYGCYGEHLFNPNLPTIIVESPKTAVLAISKYELSYNFLAILGKQGRLNFEATQQRILEKYPTYDFAKNAVFIPDWDKTEAQFLSVLPSQIDRRFLVSDIKGYDLGDWIVDNCHNLPENILLHTISQEQAKKQLAQVEQEKQAQKLQYLGNKTHKIRCHTHYLTDSTNVLDAIESVFGTKKMVLQSKTGAGKTDYFLDRIHRDLKANADNQHFLKKTFVFVPNLSNVSDYFERAVENGIPVHDIAIIANEAFIEAKDQNKALNRHIEAAKFVIVTFASINKAVSYIRGFERKIEKVLDDSHLLSLCMELRNAKTIQDICSEQALVAVQNCLKEGQYNYVKMTYDTNFEEARNKALFQLTGLSYELFVAVAKGIEAHEDFIFEEHEKYILNQLILDSSLDFEFIFDEIHRFEELSSYAFDFFTHTNYPTFFCSATPQKMLVKHFDCERLKVDFPKELNPPKNYTFVSSQKSTQITCLDYFAKEYFLAPQKRFFIHLRTIEEQHIFKQFTEMLGIEGNKILILNSKENKEILDTATKTHRFDSKFQIVCFTGVLEAGVSIYTDFDTVLLCDNHQFPISVENSLQIPSRLRASTPPQVVVFRNDQPKTAAEIEAIKEAIKNDLIDALPKLLKDAFESEMSKGLSLEKAGNSLLRKKEFYLQKKVGKHQEQLHSYARILADKLNKESNIDLLNLENEILLCHKLHDLVYFDYDENIYCIDHKHILDISIRFQQSQLSNKGFAKEMFYHDDSVLFKLENRTKFEYLDMIQEALKVEKEKKQELRKESKIAQVAKIETAKSFEELADENGFLMTWLKKLLALGIDFERAKQLLLENTSEVQFSELYYKQKALYLDKKEKDVSSRQKKEKEVIKAFREKIQTFHYYTAKELNDIHEQIVNKLFIGTTIPLHPLVRERNGKLLFLALFENSNLFDISQKRITENEQSRTAFAIRPKQDSGEIFQKDCFYTLEMIFEKGYSLKEFKKIVRFKKQVRNKQRGYLIL